MHIVLSHPLVSASHRIRLTDDRSFPPCFFFFTFPLVDVCAASIVRTRRASTPSLHILLLTASSLISVQTALDVLL